nr:MAG TPA: hypothetical protein [Caudoviricetes sp.]DAG07439.1 MAG TPA: hypothetical protein [Bacteriophage sp.]DAK61616.1 MAG TPA: hypothetical protein [Bacteriophage sp.]DAQ34989.1 MAG TPA: hypothetical protein [Bacteriophage sp.]DAQ41419.1 MAG TPA: hypothetical protein [Caudoviricetes sp.]
MNNSIYKILQLCYCENIKIFAFFEGGKLDGRY